MLRFLKVIGVDGVIVPDPHSNSGNGEHRRFVGKQLLDFSKPEVQAAFDELEGHHHERFENVEQVIQSGPSLLAEIKEGHLALLGECEAKSLGHAIAKFEAQQPAKPSAQAPKPKGDPPPG